VPHFENWRLGPSNRRCSSNYVRLFQFLISGAFAVEISLSWLAVMACPPTVLTVSEIVLSSSHQPTPPSKSLMAAAMSSATERPTPRFTATSTIVLTTSRTSPTIALA
jgi:hypothetical protein